MKTDLQRTIRQRIMVIGAIIFGCFALLALRLFFSQIRSGSEYRKKISSQSIRRIRIPAQRGRIYTRDLKVLADTVPCCDLVLYVNEIRRPRRRDTISGVMEVAERVSRTIGRANPLTRSAVSEHLNRRPGLPLVLFTDLDESERARAAGILRSENAVALEANSRRSYPSPSPAPHLVGYVRPESPKQAEDRKEFFYYIPDQIGISGVEKVFDRIEASGSAVRGLRGVPGYSLVQVNNLGFVHQTLIEELESLPGNHAVLTVDSRAQEIAERLLGDFAGAFVLMDADTGEVLALASTPGYDLNKFSPRLPKAYYQELLSDPRKPLLDRSLRAALMPGSIFKPLVALAALAHGIKDTDTVVCDGGTRIGNATLRCTASHGIMTMRDALKYSCNDYFVETGMKIGRAAIYDMAQSAGIGQATGFELPDGRGVAPSLEYKLRNEKRKWNAFDTALVSIGQGTVLVTPLQAAMYTAALANGGKVYRPHILKSLVDQNGNELMTVAPEVLGMLDATEEQLKVVQEGMFKVVNDSNGSGVRARVKGLDLYGKTGTAEVGSRSNRTKNTWFIAFCTYEGKRYASVFMVQDGASGGRTCGPLMRDFYREYFNIAQ